MTKVKKGSKQKERSKEFIPTVGLEVVTKELGEKREACVSVN